MFRKYKPECVSINICMCLAQLCPTLCDPMDCSLRGSSVHGIFQARVLEWLPIPSPGDLPDPGIELGFLALQADALPSKPPESLNFLKLLNFEYYYLQIVNDLTKG